MTDLSNYHINIGTIRMVDDFPAHLSVRGKVQSVWEKYMTGKVYELQVPANAVTKNGRKLWQSTVPTIRQCAYAYSVKTFGRDARGKPVKRTRMLYQYDEANGRLYFKVTFEDRKVKQETNEETEGK